MSVLGNCLIRLKWRQVLDRGGKLRVLSMSLATAPPPSSGQPNRIGFIGTGKIAQSIIQAIVKKNLIKPENIYASDINKEYLSYLREKSDVFQVNNVNPIFIRFKLTVETE